MLSLASGESLGRSGVIPGEDVITALKKAGTEEEKAG